LFSFTAKKFLQNLRAFCREHTGRDFHPMIQTGMVNDLENGARSASLRIGSAVHQSRNAGMDQRTSAHCARLDGCDQHTADQAMITQSRGGHAQGNDLSVGGGIVIKEIAIVTAGNDCAIFDY
jgi:hypothetical protein